MLDFFFANLKFFGQNKIEPCLNKVEPYSNKVQSYSNKVQPYLNNIEPCLNRFSTSFQSGLRLFSQLCASLKKFLLNFFKPLDKAIFFYYICIQF